MSGSHHAVDLPAQADSGRIAGRLRIALVVICVTQLMMVLDGTVVTVALPSIQRGLDMSMVGLVWVTTAYTLTFGGFLLFGGRIGDLYGRRRLFMIGVGLFTVGSLGSGLAVNDISLIVTRGLQGIGGAIASPTALSLVITNFPEGKLRSRAMGAYAGMSAVGGAIGQIVGGVLVDMVSWRWIFFISVPFGLFIMFLSPRVLDEGQHRRGRLDVIGALAVTAGMVLLVFGLTNAASHGWGAASVVRSLIGGVALLVFFVIWEARTPHALMPLRIFKDRNRAGAYTIGFFLGTSGIAAFFFVSLYLQQVLGFSALQTGLSFLPIAGVVIIATQVASRLVNRYPPHLLIAAGAFLVALGLGWLSTMDANSSFFDILLPQLVLWYGSGTTMVPLVLTAVSSVSEAEAGLASAVHNTCQRMGGAIGLGVLATVSIMVTDTDLKSTSAGAVTEQARHAALTHGYAQALFVGACIAIFAFALTMLILGTSRGRLARKRARLRNPVSSDGSGLTGQP
ncbi:MFS transporter [Dactylosporangium roseum]|uniref:MFS transporter n=1 Tax=Dactylosporangium roseum TaxID=47989 RepID=A0ABY5ZAS3_9ACTN|nr:MFS transporter [Dactylosporangium roseum]UWZ39185.1 MFS transporter [Dactylosporangium roseum]